MKAPAAQPNSMNAGASTFQPVAAAPSKPVKPVEPKKEKVVLMLERIVKGSDVDVKNDEITADDTTKITKMQESIAEVKSTSKISVQLLRSLCDVMSGITKLPEGLVKMSVHSRLIARKDEGDAQPLLDKGGPKRNNDNQGGYGNKGRGRGGGRDNYHNNREGGYNHPGGSGGRGRGGNRHNDGGFATNVNQQPQHN